MNHNPYAAPQAPVDDPAEQRLLERPKVVTVAAWLLWTELFLSAVGGLWTLRKVSEDVPLVVIVAVQLFLLSISAWINYKIWVGRNWARITGLVLTMLWLPLTFSEFKESLHTVDTLTAVLTVVTFGLDAVALYLVFVPGRNWYAKR